MSTVIFKRAQGHSEAEFPIVDGQLLFDELDHRIYMDNGNTRLQYGGDTTIIQDAYEASPTNVFSASSSVGLFLQKTTVVDDKDNALAVTSDYIPLGCLAFKEALGTDDYSGVGYGANIGTVSNGLVALRGETVSGVLNVGETSITLQAPTLLADSYVDVYTDNSVATPATVEANDVAKTITLTFKAQEVPVGIRIIVRNMQ